MLAVCESGLSERRCPLETYLSHSAEDASAEVCICVSNAACGVCEGVCCMCETAGVPYVGVEKTQLCRTFGKPKEKKCF